MTKLRTSPSRRRLKLAILFVLALQIALPGVRSSERVFAASIVETDSPENLIRNRSHQREQVPAQHRKQPSTTNEPLETKKGNALEDINRSMVQDSSEGGALTPQFEPQALPNLTPFQPSGWSESIVVSNVVGTHTNSNPLRTTDTLYVDWAVINNGGVATSARFYTKLFIDGVDSTNWFSDPPLNPGFYGYIEDYSIGSLSAGTHTIRIVADAFNDITESSEFDNEYTKTITVSAAALPNLTPFQPSGWSDKVVVSAAPGAHTDGTLRTTDTLYVDWAVTNNGGAPTSARFHTKLFVDGIERASWFSDPPVIPASYVYVDDYSIGSLSAGTHSLRIVADALNEAPESNEFDNEFTKTINVTVPAVSNLAPFQPTGWTDKIIVASVTGTHSDGTTLRPTDTLYVDFAAINNGSGATTARFYTKLFVDGVEKNSWFTDPPLNVGFYAFVEDYSIGSLSAGIHTIRIVTDSFNDIAESNEFDNEYIKSITVVSAAFPNLTPYQPSGWSDKIVVSTVSGTHSDSVSLRPTDSLFVDWGAINNGAAATSTRYYTKLLVDGVEKGSWFTEPPLNVGFYTSIEDYPIGILSAGSHTIRLVADALSNIAESNEFDNDYTKTINVSGATCNTLTINVSPSEGGSISKTPEPSCFGSLDASPKPDIASLSLTETPTKTTAPDGSGRTAAMTERFRRLISRAEVSGPVRVIVGLRVSFQPEGMLSTQSVQSQHRTITQLEDVLLARLSAFNMRDVKKFETIPFIAMEADAAGLTYLEGSPDVSSIEQDVAVPPSLAESVPLIGAPAAWAAGFSGAGQTVAILDTGVDKTHPFLAGKVVSEACFSTTGTTSTGGSFSSVCPGGALTSTAPGSGVNCPFSACDHGTHVAGIVGGKGSSFSGVAKDASIIAIQVFSLFNSSTDCGDNPAPCAKSQTSDQIRGLERVLALAGSFNIASVNMSLGGGRFTTNCDSEQPSMKAAIDNLRSRGIATIIASGNDGHTDGISFPGCISSAVSVGSTDDGSLGTVVDVVSDFGRGRASNSAFFLNLLAPGNWIYSSLPNGRYENFQGTSMATPHVAGAWAILKSKAPSASVDQILSALTNTGVSITDFRNGIVKPRIRVDAALNALAGGGVLRYGSDNVVTLTANPNSGFAFVKWQRDGVDFSTNRVVSVAMNIEHTLTAVFRLGNSGPAISSVTVDSPKITRILGTRFSQSPRVLINGIDRSDFITASSDSSITLKGKQKKVGLRAGDNNVQVIDASGNSSNILVLRL